MREPQVSGLLMAKFLYTFDTRSKRWDVLALSGGAHTFGIVKSAFLMDDLLFAYTWNEKKQAHVFAQLDLIHLQEWKLMSGAQPNCIDREACACIVESRKEMMVLASKAGKTLLMMYSLDAQTCSEQNSRGKPPTPHGLHAACATTRSVFVLERVRGISPIWSSAKLYVLNIESRRFTWSLPDIPLVQHQLSLRSRFQLCCSETHLFIYGADKHFDVYSIKDERWLKGVRQPDRNRSDEVHFVDRFGEGILGHTTILTNGSLLVFGGSNRPIFKPLEIRPDRKAKWLTPFCTN